MVCTIVTWSAGIRKSACVPGDLVTGKCEFSVDAIEAVVLLIV